MRVNRFLAIAMSVILLIAGSNTVQAGVVGAWAVREILRIFGFETYFHPGSQSQVIPEIHQLEGLGLNQSDLATCLSEAHNKFHGRIGIGHNFIVINEIPRDCFLLIETFKNRGDVAELEALYGDISILNNTSVSFGGLSNDTILEFRQFANRKTIRKRVETRLPFEIFIIDGE
jgi:hypothetical protein